MTTHKYLQTTKNKYEAIISTLFRWISQVTNFE